MSGGYIQGQTPPKTPKKPFFLQKNRLAAIFMTQKSFSGTFYKQEDFSSILVPKMSKSDKNYFISSFSNRIYNLCKNTPNKNKIKKIIVTIIFGQFGKTLYQNMSENFNILKNKKKCDGGNIKVQKAHKNNMSESYIFGT